MIQRKKTSENLPSTLLKQFIENSEACTWDEAKLEWEMKGYYYLAKGYKACPCSPKGINNITVITNKYNSNQLEICNSCAQLYLNISESNKIATSLNRVRKNLRLGMNEEALNYLLLNLVIPQGEFECYNAAKSVRNNELVIRYREITNSKLINFTDYHNKLAYDKIDYILIWANTCPEIDISQVVAIRNNLINGSLGEIELLDNIIQDNQIENKNLSNAETEKIRMLIKRYICSKNIDYEAHRKYLPPVKDCRESIIKLPKTETNLYGKHKFIVSAEGLEEGFPITEEAEENEKEVDFEFLSLSEKIDVMQFDSSIPDYCTPEDIKVINAYREEKRKFYNYREDWEIQWHKDIKRKAKLAVLEAYDKACNRRELETRMLYDEWDYYKTNEIDKDLEIRALNSYIKLNKEEPGIIRAEKIYESSGEPIRFYGDENMLESRCFTLIKFIENNARHWNAIFYGKYGKIAVSKPHDIILILTTHYLFQLDKKTGDIMEWEENLQYANLTLTPKGDFLIAGLFDNYIEKITSNIKSKEIIKSPIRYENINFQDWDKENLNIKCGGYYKGYPVATMIYNNDTNKIELIDDGCDSLFKK